MYWGDTQRMKVWKCECTEEISQQDALSNMDCHNDLPVHSTAAANSLLAQLMLRLPNPELGQSASAISVPEH